VRYRSRALTKREGESLGRGRVSDYDPHNFSDTFVKGSRKRHHYEEKKR